jgi:hypothetical protein
MQNNVSPLTKLQNCSKKVVKTLRKRRSLLIGEYHERGITIGVIVLLILGIAWLGKKVFAPEKVADTTFPVQLLAYTATRFMLVSSWETRNPN